MKLRTAVLVGCVLGIGVMAPSVARATEPRGADQRGPSDRDRAAAEKIVRSAYLDVLEREADKDGLRSYTDKILRDRWSDADVRRTLRSSDEYRRLQARRSSATEHYDQKKAVDPSTATDAGTGGCAAFDFYEHNALDRCKKECTGNRKLCVKKQQCGGRPCPDPGYCWVCTKQ